MPLSNNYFLAMIIGLHLVYCHPNTTFQLSEIQFKTIQTLVLVVRHLVYCYPSTSFQLSDIQFIAIRKLGFSVQTSCLKLSKHYRLTSLRLVYSYYWLFFMSIASLLLSNDQFLAMPMMSLQAKTYLKTSFLANEKLVLLYLMNVQKLTIATM